MAGIRYLKIASIVSVLCAMVLTSHAQTFTTIATFDGKDGNGPWHGPLVQGTDGNLYGTTINGGASLGCYEAGCGTFFRLTPDGTLTSLHSFCLKSGCIDGEMPYVGVIQTGETSFYGVTAFGGLGNCPSFDDSCGTVFKITTGGVLTILHRFNGTDGAGPEAMLVRGPNGNFYGTTVFGGTACTEAGCGTVFEMTRDGTLTTLHSFDSMHGEHPNGLIHAPDGNFYGTTSDGGAGSGGTVFKMTPGGPVSTLYNFCSKNDCADGKFPGGSLVQSTDGNFYGTTQHGGNSVCSLGCGTVFKVTRNGTLMTLHTFDGSDGAYPNIGLVLATDGNLYGTTLYGGTGCAPYGCGTIFKITATGTLTTLHKFDNSDGSGPGSPLLQATNGTFYGTTEYGLNNSGTVFSLSVGLGPFVKTQPTFGKVGAKIVILGSNLRGATGVSFNGTPAPYKVLSDTVITTTVPIGATTGAIQITTPDGNLLSNLPFEVIR